MTPDARAAKERKQKIFVVVGGLFLVALLAIQVPKLLGGSSTPEAASTTPTDAAIATPAAPPGTTGIAVANVDAALSRSKISRFSAFSVKDPFVQQVVPKLPAEPSGGETGADAKATKKEASPPTKFAIDKPTASAVTVITVNGVRQVVAPGAKFPKSDPLFVLAAEKPGSKSVVVSIAGGAYASGAKSTILRVGKPLTLENTTTGARYRIALVSVGSGDAPDAP